MKTQVLIVDERAPEGAALARLLADAADLAMVGVVANSEEALRLIMDREPEVVVLGPLAGRGQELRCLEKLGRATPRPAFVVVAEEEDPRQAEQALKAGASGYLSLASATLRLPDVVREVAQGHISISRRLSERFLQRMTRGHGGDDRDPSRILSTREMEILLLTGQGLEAKEIAEQLSISPRTVDVHRANIRTKLGLHGAHELVRFAMQWDRRRAQEERLKDFGRKASPLLLVEDDEVDIRGVERALDRLGCDVELVATRTGEEALHYLRSGRNPVPRLVLLDIKMPGMDGAEFLNELRRVPELHSLPVVVLSASRLEEDRRRMYSLGVSGYLVKPATSKELTEMIGLLANYWSANEPPPEMSRITSTAA